MTNGVLSRVAFLLCIACSMCMTHATAASGAAPESVAFNITTAAVVVQGDIDAIAPALDVLLEGVRIRSLITLSVSTSGAVADNPLIVLGSRSRGGTMKGHGESFTITVSGASARGVLFGVGHLLRHLDASDGLSYSAPVPPQLLLLDDVLMECTAPSLWLRSVMISYRATSNCYDGWDETLMREYVRDVAVFGGNTVEWVAPDGNSSPHFTRTPAHMITHISNTYVIPLGLNVSIWWPSNTPNEAWDEVVPLLDRLDALFIPSGDPGSDPPDVFLEFVHAASNRMRKDHPDAQMWISVQDFNSTWLRQILDTLNDDASVQSWLTGVVYGPGTRVTLPELRGNLSLSYPLRHYPDVCHQEKCEFPQPNWSYAFGFTEQRESVNPRPLQEHHIHRLLGNSTIGFGLYSDGCNDDVNKMVWTRTAWKLDERISSILLQYGRYHLGSNVAVDCARLALMLERNWNTSMLSPNGGKFTAESLEVAQRIEDGLTYKQKLQWRIQALIMRAYMDSYLAARIEWATAQESDCLATLSRSTVGNTTESLSAALSIIQAPFTNAEALGYRVRVSLYADRLYQSARMQLSLSEYGSRSLGRGDTLDLLDNPLNDHIWLEAQITRIQALSSPAEQLVQIKVLVGRTDVGANGIYTDLGNREVVSAAPNPALPGLGVSLDPYFHYTPFTGFQQPFNATAAPVIPLSWLRYSETLYDDALVLSYSDLDPTTPYHLRVVYYAGSSSDNPVRLMADSSYVVHDYMPKPFPIAPLTFAVPQNLTGDGALTLAFNQPPGEGGNGRSVQVAEIMLAPFLPPIVPPVPSSS